MLYTRTGDGGTSGLFGTKERFPKHSRIYEALGTVDECNSLLGLCRAQARVQKSEAFDVAEEIIEAQQCLFIIQAELAGASKTITDAHIKNVEDTIAAIETLIGAPHAFVIPGATELSALFDCARAVCRRAERAVAGAGAERPVSLATGAYLNRLSSLLYALARYTAAMAGVKEMSPTY